MKQGTWHILISSLLPSYLLKLKISTWFLYAVPKQEKEVSKENKITRQTVTDTEIKLKPTFYLASRINVTVTCKKKKNRRNTQVAEQVTVFRLHNSDAIAD
jgi:hypothetical protein